MKLELIGGIIQETTDELLIACRPIPPMTEQSKKA